MATEYEDVTLRLPKGLVAQLKEEAAVLHLTLSQTIELALEL
jgi:hypothetical protein